MIQRIQTVYLLVSTVLIALLFLLPFAGMMKDGVDYLFSVQGISVNGTVQKSGFGIALVIGTILLLQVFAIASFKKRTLQMRVVMVSILLMLGLMGMFYFFTALKFSGALISYKISMVFPLIAIVLDYLAIRGIKKDDALIRSIDRIR